MVSGDRAASAGPRRIALIVQYDGTDFNGWQIQPEGRCVQVELERACSSICNNEIHTVCAGRTDAGVHALGQVVHFNTSSAIKLHRLCIGLNGILPRDIAVRNAYDVHSEFNARFDAVEREYMYLFNINPLRSPFMIHRALWITRDLDMDYLEKASSYLIGTHDFSSFCKTSSSVDINTIRTVESITWDRRGSLLVFTIRGNAFLHNMIRSIVGTILDIHRKGFPPERMREILEYRDRRKAGDTAAAHGLYLTNVRYKPELSSYPSAFPGVPGSMGYFI
ncbi:MAG TPA: tRNA pseudouridine(38-40) synthase TruA [Spirochaetota bacterium]|nr:tRNA pseudouridine(38-40) synthase TruA [Spirochaetota bacterium]